MKGNMKTLISNTGSGKGGIVIEFNDLADLATKIDHKGAFARISYTNHDWHPRSHTWYPVLGLLEGMKTDYEFETTWIDGYRKTEQV